MRENTCRNVDFRCADLIVLIPAFPSMIALATCTSYVFFKQKKKCVDLLATFILPEFPLKLLVSPKFRLSNGSMI
jgi:hypothetical protein